MEGMVVISPASAALEDDAGPISGERASAGAGTYTPGHIRACAYMRALSFACACVVYSHVRAYVCVCVRGIYYMGYALDAMLPCDTNT